MTWLAALAALAKIVLAILEMARDRQAEGAGRADAIAESATDALELIRTRFIRKYAKQLKALRPVIEIPVTT